MNWGCRIDSSKVGWGQTFNLEVDRLEIDAEAISGRLPVLGRSGSGKSTLLYLSSFLKLPKEGQVLWTFPDGHTAAFDQHGLVKSKSSLTMKEVRRSYFGFAHQKSTLSPYLKVGENLRYPLALQRNLSDSEMDEKVYRMVNRVLLCGQGGGTIGGEDSVSELLERYPNELSGGQLQRVALAQAMIHDPCVLFADEPTGNLDAATRKEVMSIVEEWLGESNRLFMWVTHHLSDALDSRVTHRLVVSHGRCHLQGRDQGNPLDL
ncbi:MAG: ATP-binding cassette domain-containing protein [Magnetococcales bacterium]|nr:ATP-binding cassette domain-containing protein [Magnetococcales bacterium]